MNFADPKSDIAFKKIFWNENKKEILISFLNAVLDLKCEREIKEITILNLKPVPAADPKGIEGNNCGRKSRWCPRRKFYCGNAGGKRPYYDKRLLYYTRKAYVSQIEQGEDFPRLNQVIFIGILDFKMFKGNNYLTRHLILNTETLKQEITDLEFNFIEPPKFNKTEDELKTITDKWAYFIKNAENLKLIPKTLQTTEEIVEAFEAANRHEWTKEETDAYDSWRIKEVEEELTIEEAKKKGYEKGMEKGI